MKALENKLKSQAHDGGIPEDFVNFFSGDKKDSRLALAGQIASENRSNISAQALNMISGREASPQEHFLAMAHVINNRASELDDYFTNQYLPSANDGKDSVASQIVNLGMGTAMRSIFDESENGLATVRSKIDAVKTDGYRVASLLQEAASTPVSQLTESDRSMLMNYGYVGKDDQGNFHYQVPTNSRGINDVMDVNLPTSSWLDVVSVRSVGETGVGMATGVASAQLAATMARAGKFGTTGTAALTTLMEVTASSGSDAMMNKLHGKNADFDKALLQNLTMAGAGKLMGSVGDELLKGNSAWRDAIEDTAKRSSFQRLMEATSGKGNLLDSDDMRRFIATSVGLSSEASIETMYQAAIEGGPISRDAFMANLFSGAMSKTASLALQHTGKAANEELIKRLPPEVQKWARENPAVLTEAFERARKSDSHAAEAVSRFEAIKRDVAGTDGGKGADAYRNPALADRVMDGLKSGALRWSDLGIIAEKEGAVASELLQEVKNRRTEWAYGVSEPKAGQVNDAARAALDADYASQIAKVNEGTGTPESKKAAVERLQQEQAAVIEQLGKEKPDKTPEGLKAGKARSKAEEKLFNDNVMTNGIGPEVKDRALRELDREYAMKRQDLMTGENRPKSKEEMEARLKALDQEQAANAESIRNAKMIAPGSKDPTSDIDRSWSEPRVLQAMKSLQRDRLLTESNGVRGIGPTTAKAFDLNEYYNVMEGVKSAMPMRNDPEKGFANEKVTIEGVGEVTHDDAVAGNSLAAAMSHMSEDRRKLYRANMIEAVADKPEALALKQKEFAIAERALAASDERLSKARNTVAEKYGLDPNSDEAGIYARDLVYGESMREVKALDTKLAGTPEGTPEWKKLQSERERLMNQASRDGIEAYTDAAGLDVIVNRMQSKTNEDGSKMSVNDLWKDPKFNRDGDLKHLSKRQLDSMMNDQTMMISEHLAACMNGDETPHQTARALAKYGQRAALVAKMNGENLPPGHPLRQLYETASKLIDHKGDPAAMHKALEELAGPGGTYRDGLDKLRGMVEKAVPGLKNYTANDANAPRTHQPGVPSGFSSLSSYRDWLRDRDNIYNRGGQSAVNRWLTKQRQAVDKRRDEVNAEKAELLEMSKNYLPEDFKAARRLQDRLAAVKELMACFPIDGKPTEDYIKLLQEKAELERQIKELKDKKEAWEKEHGALPEHPSLKQIEKELEALEEQAKMLDEALEKGTHPPDFVPTVRDEEEEKNALDEIVNKKSSSTVDLEKSLDEEFNQSRPKVSESNGRKGGIIGGLEEVTEQIGK